MHALFPIFFPVVMAGVEKEKELALADLHAKRECSP